MFNRRNAWLAGCVSVLGLAVGSVNAGLINFEELPGDESAIATDYQPVGLPVGVSTTFTDGFLGSFAGEPGSDGGLYVFIEVADGTISFSGDVEVPSLFLDGTYLGFGGFANGTVTGLLDGNTVWTGSVAQGAGWTEITTGAGQTIDALAFNGSFLGIDAVTVNSAVVPEPASLGLLAVGGLMMLRRRAM
ncbi:MAG: PEP-CTERM sorting domain-containing protein [Phycisphaerales bacterium]|nr:PEP-CTERM sorting domain-containing protein [Phycisphaerales bacterium]